MFASKTYIDETVYKNFGTPTRSNEKMMTNKNRHFIVGKGVGSIDYVHLPSKKIRY